MEYKKMKKLKLINSKLKKENIKLQHRDTQY